MSNELFPGGNQQPNQAAMPAPEAGAHAEPMTGATAGSQEDTMTWLRGLVDAAMDAPFDPARQYVETEEQRIARILGGRLPEFHSRTLGRHDLPAGFAARQAIYRTLFGDSSEVRPN